MTYTLKKDRRGPVDFGLRCLDVEDSGLTEVVIMLPG